MVTIHVTFQKSLFASELYRVIISDQWRQSQHVGEVEAFLCALCVGLPPARACRSLRDFHLTQSANSPHTYHTNRLLPVDRTHHAWLMWITLIGESRTGCALLVVPATSVLRCAVRPERSAQIDFPLFLSARAGDTHPRSTLQTSRRTVSYRANNTPNSTRPPPLDKIFKILKPSNIDGHTNSHRPNFNSVCMSKAREGFSTLTTNRLQRMQEGDNQLIEANTSSLLLLLPYLIS